MLRCRYSSFFLLSINRGAAHCRYLWGPMVAMFCAEFSPRTTSVRLSSTLSLLKTSGVNWGHQRCATVLLLLICRWCGTSYCFSDSTLESTPSFSQFSVECSCSLCSEYDFFLPGMFAPPLLFRLDNSAFSFLLTFCLLWRGCLQHCRYDASGDLERYVAQLMFFWLADEVQLFVAAAEHNHVLKSNSDARACR